LRRLLHTTVIGVALLLSPAAALAAEAPTSLGALAAARGVTFGTAVNADVLAASATYRDRLGTEFGGVPPEDAMKWAVVEPERGRYDWARADAVVDFAVAHGQTVRGHTLVWHDSLPAWLTTGSFTADELRAVLRAHIERTVTRYAGRVTAWDVVNEAFNADGTLRRSMWLDKLGEGYIADAFRWARAADPNARLYLNDYDVEWIGPKSTAMLTLVRQLRAQGVPIDGVGVQTHVQATTRLSQLTRALRRFAALGVDVAITELDARVPLPADAAALAAQAQAYRSAVAACLAVERCRSITVWGFTDAHSWIPAGFPGWGAAALLDAQYAAKPAYTAVHDTLTSWQPPANEPNGWWWLDDPYAFDASPNGRHATVQGTATLGTEGRAPGSGAYADTGAGEASTAGPVVRTDASYTVSAWVRLTDASEARVAVSQNGPEVSGFYLMYQQYSNRWEFTVPSAGRQPLTWQTAQASAIPQRDVWTHLAGVYDATNRRLLIYVNGTLAGQRDGVVSWSADGPLRIGRSQSGAHFAGRITDVRTWPRALGAAELTVVADPRVGVWTLDSTTGDSGPLGRDATRSPAGVSWTSDRTGGPGRALALDGTGWLDAPGPMLHTGQSYSVAAWVRLGDLSGYRVAVSQDGAVRSAFYLEYHQDYRRWAYIVPTADSNTGGWQTALSTSVPVKDAWTQLVAVYDAVNRQLRLYVNGRLEATVAGAVSWPSGGPLRIGRTAGGSQWSGGIDDVRVYARALSNAEVAAL
jgi:GH35 family endo-1,4-beta-xylanase